VGELDCDTCHLLGQCYGATWPSRGLPCGTPPVWLESNKFFVTPQELNPRPLGVHGRALA
jgi:hypothetical protein